MVLSEKIYKELHWHMPAAFLPPLSFVGLFLLDDKGYLWEVLDFEIDDHHPDVKVHAYLSRPLDDDLWRAEYKLGMSVWFKWAGREPERIDNPLWKR